MKQNPSKYLTRSFWFFMLLAQVLTGLLFKDLADISQWIIQSDRAETMWVWYNRWTIAISALVAMSIALFIKYKYHEIVKNKTLILLALLFSFSFYSGMINPHIMMRARANEGVFIPASQAAKYIAPNESVIVLVINGKARAHSDKQLLRPHVSGNGELGGEKVVMTYCGLTNLGIAYSPVINGQVLDLAPMSQLENNLVMYDKISGEPIQQLWGQKEVDKNSGSTAKMREWPTFRMPFNKFVQAYPDGEVFINDYLVDDMKSTFWQNPFLAIYDPMMEIIFEHAIKDQATSVDPTFPTLKHIDSRLPSKEKIYGLNIGDDYVAYTLDFVINQAEPINVRIGDKQVVINYDQQYQSLGFFYNETGDKITKVDFFGKSPQGTLSRVETVKAAAYWVIWANFFPTTDINRT